MEDEEQKKQSKSLAESGKEKLEGAGEKIEKAKKAVKVFMKLPTPMKIAILVVPLVFILLIVFLGGAAYLLNILGFESAAKSKQDLVGGIYSSSPGSGQEGTGYSYSDKIVKLDGNTWNLQIDDELITDELREQVEKKGKKIEDLTQDELIIELLILHGLNEEDFNEEERELFPYFLKAELASMQADLRSASEMYDSNGEYIQPTNDVVKNSKIQGTVHFKRINFKNADDTIVLSYINYEDFKKFSEGDVTSTDLEEAKKYFSYNDKGELVIYTWNNTKYEYTYKKGKKEVPDDKKIAETNLYYLQETVIDYKALVEKYTLPYELLTALLITTENTGFAKQVADLAFTSNIEVGIIEEFTQDATVNTTEYFETERNYKHVYGSAVINGETISLYSNPKLISKETANDKVNCPGHERN